MKNIMSPIERCHAALRHQPVDRVPVSAMAWFIGARAGETGTKPYATDGAMMAKGQLAFLEKTGVDMLHPMSDVGQMASGWGTVMRYTEGLAPMLDAFSIKEPEDWEKMRVLDPKKDGRMHVPTKAISIMRKDPRGKNVSMMPYIPSPLTSTTHVRAMEEVLIDILLNPEPLKKGLQTIADTTIEYGNALFDAGADGLLYATTRASAEIVTLDQYNEFAAAYDRHVLSKLDNQDGLNIQHVCGLEPFFDLLSDYPNCAGINWWDRGARLKIKEAKQRWGKKTCLVCGMDQTTTLMIGSMDDIKNEVKDTIQQGFADGTGLIIAPGCEISPNTDFAKIRAMMEAAEQYGKKK
jgi:MtaA/CmuA family methyltransferase